MNKYEIIKNALLGDTVTDVIVYGGKIISIGKTTTLADDVIDLDGARLLPGLVDIHTHGALGYDTMDAHSDGLCKMAKFLKENGVTSFYPTTMTMGRADIEKALSQEIPTGAEYAEVLGFHMEGPYISAKHKGAQNEADIKDPTVAEFSGFKGVKLLTLAPELAGSAEVIKYCAENGIRTCLGHTDADYDTALEAFGAGADCLTHTFNAMPPMLHRAPGPVGAAITANAYAQVICDGIHIHPAVINALYRIFGADRMILISDAMRATGMPDGGYMFGGQPMTVKNSVARTADGALAGSTSTLLHCVEKAIEFGIPAPDAYKMASETPAKMMGLRKGRIEVGFDANFIVATPDYKFIRTLM